MCNRKVRHRCNGEDSGDIHVVELMCSVLDCDL